MPRNKREKMKIEEFMNEVKKGCNILINRKLTKTEQITGTQNIAIVRKK